MTWLTHPALLAVAGALCLQGPAAGIPMPPAKALLAIGDGFGLLLLAYEELLRRRRA